MLQSECIVSEKNEEKIKIKIKKNGKTERSPMLGGHHNYYCKKMTVQTKII